MPVYEYECTQCGHHMEVWQKISDSPVECCELCSGKTKKLISQSSFHLKGTGWYVTDYASRNRTSEAKKSAAPKTEGTTTTKAKEKSSTKTAPDSSGTSSKKAKD